MNQTTLEWLQWGGGEGARGEIYLKINSIGEVSHQHDTGVGCHHSNELPGDERDHRVEGSSPGWSLWERFNSLDRLHVCYETAGGVVFWYGTIYTLQQPKHCWQCQTYIAFTVPQTVVWSQSSQSTRLFPDAVYTQKRMNCLPWGLTLYLCLLD